MNIEKNYTTNEVAQVFRVTEYTVREWLKDPDHPLTGIKINRQWLVPESNLKTFLEQKHG